MLVTYPKYIAPFIFGGSPHFVPFPLHSANDRFRPRTQFWSMTCRGSSPEDNRKSLIEKFARKAHPCFFSQMLWGLDVTITRSQEQQAVSSPLSFHFPMQLEEKSRHWQPCLSVSSCVKDRSSGSRWLQPARRWVSKILGLDFKFKESCLLTESCGIFIPFCHSHHPCPGILQR